MGARDKPDWCYSSGCPLADKGRGFALGAGPIEAPVSILFERPAQEEISYALTGPLPQMPLESAKRLKKWREEEVARREAAYPELAGTKWVRVGAPVRGMSGAELRTWVGLDLDAHFLENVLHCAGKDNEYPTGKDRVEAERCCSHWNRLKGIDVSVISVHPASLLKDKGGGIVALPLQIDSYRKAKSFARQGKKVLVLAGGKAAKWWLGFGDAVTRWCGHYVDDSEVKSAREERLKCAQD